jgi:hypothetical protein
VDEAVFDDGEAELLVELVQRLHLVHGDCRENGMRTCNRIKKPESGGN